MSVLFLSEDDVAAVVTIDDALAAVRGAFVAQAYGRAFNAPRERVHLGDALLQVMGGLVPAEVPTAPAGPPASGWMISKIGASTSATRRTWSLLFDPQANLRCILLSQRLGQLRTAAASAVSVDALARKDAEIVAMVGAGFHAWTHVQAIARLRPALRFLVWSRTSERAESFARRAQAELDVEIEPRGDVDAAVGAADAVVTMTTAAEPVLRGAAVRPGTHVVLAGSNFPRKREADAELFRRATAVYVDDVAQAKLESGDLILAHDEGAFDWERVRLMAAAVAATEPPRCAGDVTVFSSHGVGMWDCALAVRAYEQARAQGAGTHLDLDGTAISKER
jgi:ornithine cyclodeaminase/alanine dehydrogenase